MFRLAHISDPHLGPLPPVSLRDLASKRVTGYINWQRRRGRAMASPALAQIMADLAAQKADHLAITGDLVNLGLEAEVENAKAWLEAMRRACRSFRRSRQPRRLRAGRVGQSLQGLAALHVRRRAAKVRRAE